MTHTLLAPNIADLDKAIGRRSFCTIATVSPMGFPHVAGVVYATDGDSLWFSTQRSSRKARNLAANPRVHVCVPVRRAPVGPPSTIQFAATAQIYEPTHLTVRTLATNGTLKTITRHGELELEDGCLVRIHPAGTLHTYGLGLPLRALMKDPLNAAGKAERDPATILRH